MEIETKGISEQIADFIDLVGDALEEVDPGLNAWFALTQIAPQHFNGFAGYVSNPQ
jgi:hypothetical protein